MSVYRCEYCDNYVDADKDGCNEDPEGNCVCDYCIECLVEACHEL